MGCQKVFTDRGIFMFINTLMWVIRPKINTNAINTNSGRYGIQSMARNQETWGAILRQKTIKKSSNDLFLGLFPGSFEVI